MDEMDCMDEMDWLDEVDETSPPVQSRGSTPSTLSTRSIPIGLLPKAALPVFIALLAASALPARAQIEWRKETLKPVYAPGDGFYCYAPALVVEHGQETILACHNSRPGVIRDDVFLIRSAADGAAAMTTRSVLAAGPAGSWDGFHVCDPSVVSGDFKLRGQSYRRALFYLGNNADASINNQIGAAFSDSWEGPWRRLKDPLIPEPPDGLWGAGQPSAVYDGRGRLLLFYTKGIPATAGYVREADLANADAPRIGPETRLSESGLVRADGNPDYWNNFDVAYDSVRDRFWAVREQHPYPSDPPQQITPVLEILSVASADVFRSDAVWRMEGRLSPEITGHPRNHNACFARTPTGALPHSDRIRILFSTSRAGENFPGQTSLWTYALWEITGTVPPPAGADSPAAE